MQTANAPLPRDLTTAESAEAKRYAKWCMTTAARVDFLVAKGESAILESGDSIGSGTGGGGIDQLLDATKRMQETQMSFDLQYLQLQSQMQHENRSYTAISDIMKTKHDTVKNSISNMR